MSPRRTQGARIFTGVPDFLAWLDTMKPGELDRIEVSYKGE